MGAMAGRFRQFLAAVKETNPSLVIKVGDDLLAYQQNTLGLLRKLHSVIHVTSAQQIEDIIQLANNYKIALYPVSTGKNWGLGSRSPVIDNCVLLDLSAMNSILEINAEFGYARIEPGVTQAQLAQVLLDANIPFFIDVTGSGRDTSIIGNTLERGTAYNSLRVETLINMDMILGNGEKFTTGFGSSSLVANLYPYGSGPDMLGLFLQSNYGVCISACIKLQPRQQVHSAFIASVNNTEELQQLVDSLRELFNEKILNCIVHIGNERRRDISLTPIIFDHLQKSYGVPSRGRVEDLVKKESKGTWSAVGSIMGSPEQVSVIKKLIKVKLNKLAKIAFIDEKKHNLLSKVARLLSLKHKAYFLHAIKPLIGLTHGVPTNEMLRSIYWPSQNIGEHWLEPDAGDHGVYFCTPLLPMNAFAVENALAILECHAKKFNVNPAVTMNTLLGRVLECVISIDFIKSEEQSRDRAHHFVSAILDSFIAAGFPPYRVDIANMDKVVDKNKGLWIVSRQFKTIFDPNNIIAPGRYNSL